MTTVQTTEKKSSTTTPQPQDSQMDPKMDQRVYISSDVPITLTGPAADWFKLSRDDNIVVIHPARPLPARCMIKPAALFTQDRNLPEMNIVMGRMLFTPGSTQPQRFQPFTRDPHRRFREIILTTEPTPDDALLDSVTRWHNNITLAQRLLCASGITWGGLSQESIDSLVADEPWLEPMEGCLLHALTCHTHSTGECVIEIGSLRGQSINMLARALEQVGSDSKLVSVDPHLDQPLHLDQVRLSLAKIGQDHRLIQYQCLSDDAWMHIKPESASLIFIDGDHAYDQVVADFSHYRNLLATGGCMVFHDYGYGTHNGKDDVVPGVRLAIDEHVIPHPDFTPLLLGHTLFALMKN